MLIPMLAGLQDVSVVRVLGLFYKLLKECVAMRRVASTLISEIGCPKDRADSFILEGILLLVDI
jgi:hypothetical protein